MANLLPEQSRWENEITELQTTDPVLGGRGGISNEQARQLGNRTRQLNDAKIDNTVEMQNYQLGLMRAALDVLSMRLVCRHWGITGSLSNIKDSIPFS